MNAPSSNDTLHRTVIIYFNRLITLSALFEIFRSLLIYMYFDASRLVYTVAYFHAGLNSKSANQKGHRVQAVPGSCMALNMFTRTAYKLTAVL